MSDNFIDKNNANLTKNAIENLEYGSRRELSENIVNDDIQIQYDHMYATNHEQNGLLLADDTQPPCQSTESEVNFIKDFLLIHLDLIQQQNDDIINKENTIFLLQQENQQLREQIKSLQSKLAEKTTNDINVDANQQTLLDAHNNREDMIIDSTTIVLEQIPIVQPASNLQVVVGIPEEEPIEGHSGQVEASPAEPAEELKPPLITTIKAELPDRECSTSDYSHSSYTIHSSCNDQMKNLKMSIRRKRLCSNSSALSNNGSTSDEKKTFRHSRKKRKRIVKNYELLTHADEYVTQVGDMLLMDIIRRQELAEEVAKSSARSANLEVPRWRVKVYTSCYSLEGTENLEDDVFLRRHTRMENDEKRRKRWDVQRIREQRVIDKLKQRQDKIDSNSKCSTNEEAAELLTSLWPALDDIKFIEKCEDLPVSAFGTPIPKIQPSVFSLPWLMNPNIKKTLRRSGSTTMSSRRRRRSSKR